MIYYIIINVSNFNALFSCNHILYEEKQQLTLYHYILLWDLTQKEKTVLL